MMSSRWIIFAILIVLISVVLFTIPQQEDKIVNHIPDETEFGGVYIYVSPDYTFVEPEPEPDPEPIIVPAPTPEPEPSTTPPIIIPDKKPPVKPPVVKPPVIKKPDTKPDFRPKPPVKKPGTLGLESGDKLYVRIFKRERRLELWYQRGNAPYRLHKNYDICTYSGGLGPKKVVGDMKSPEGFYSTNKGRLNPYSRYYLSFNIGYPNRYDKAHGYTGDFIMVHGDCVSVGCYAMTNIVIEEIYQLVEQALNTGQKEIAVHIFPFAMTESNMAAQANSQHLKFWRELKPAYDIFERQRRVPRVTVKGKQYIIE